MQTNIKLQLLFYDRLGIVADLAAIMTANSINIISMEVQKKDDQTNVFLEAQTAAHTPRMAEIFDTLRTIPDLLEIKTIQTLPQEERENRYRVVLDNISDGVVSIDETGRITTINKIAMKILDSEDSAVIGKDIKELNLPDYTILECLNGKEFNNVKKSLITAKGRLKFFATGRPIHDSSGHIVGAVEIGKDMQEIKVLAQAISHPSQISFSDFVGHNPTIKQAMAFAQRISGTDSIISIRGASGTGKELFARAIHTASGRRGSFIPINCAALPETLLESELFGYVGGAFTGAQKQGKAGLFELAENGTIFMDEISEMPPGPQAKILRLIQEKSVRRIGGSKEIPVNTRIITATNKNLEQLVAAGLFREDLYYRINVLPIHLPPLKERTDDLPRLVEHFLFQLASKLNSPVKSLTDQAMHKLSRHDWPGNVRELKNVIERAAVCCDATEIDAGHILFSHELGKSFMGKHTEIAAAALGSNTLPALLAEYEKKIIGETLEISKSIRKAAKSLGVSHTTLLNKLKKYQG